MAPAKTKKATSARKIGYAVVGLGDIAKEAVLPAFHNARRNSRLVALVSDDPKKLKVLSRKYGGAQTFTYDRFDACLEHPDVEAVYIALPNTLHVDYAERAARAGVHVLCEKPMATSVQDCDRMIRAANESDVRLMIAYRLHFEAANLAVVEMVKRGDLGELRAFHSTFGYQVKPENIRTRAELGGGPQWDLGPYPINASRYLFRDEPLQVFAVGSKNRDARFRDVEDTVTAVLTFPEDRTASFTISLSTEPCARYTVMGSLGTVTLENAYEYKGPIELTAKIRGKERTRTFKARDQFAPELLHFSDCLIEGLNPAPSGLEGRADVVIIEGIMESLRTGKPVTLQCKVPETRPEPGNEVARPAVDVPPLINVSNPVQG